MVTNWSRSKSNFYALIGQNSTGEFMPVIYEVSWNLFTLTAEADRVLCQLVMFFSVFSPRCTKCNTAAIKRLLFFMAGLFIGFLVEKCVAFGWHRFLFLPFLMRYECECIKVNRTTLRSCFNLSQGNTVRNAYRIQDSIRRLRPTLAIETIVKLVRLQ